MSEVANVVVDVELDLMNLVISPEGQESLREFTNDFQQLAEGKNENHTKVMLKIMELLNQMVKARSEAVERDEDPEFEKGTLLTDSKSDTESRKDN